MKAKMKIAAAAAPALLPTDQGLPLAILDMIAQYEYFERQCDLAIERQDDLARSIYRRAEEVHAAEDGFTAFERDKDDTESVDVKEFASRDRSSISDIPFAEYRNLLRKAQKLVPNGLPNSNRRFVINTEPAELEEVEELEQTITMYKFHMGCVERDILESVPRDALESLAKLRFVAYLLLDGHEIEQDYFAYLVEECALIAETSIFGR